MQNVKNFENNSYSACSLNNKVEESMIAAMLVTYTNKRNGQSAKPPRQAKLYVTGTDQESSWSTNYNLSDKYDWIKLIKSLCQYAGAIWKKLNKLLCQKPFVVSITPHVVNSNCFSTLWTPDVCLQLTGSWSHGRITIITILSFS